MKASLAKIFVAAAILAAFASACGSQAAGGHNTVQVDDGSYVKGEGGKADASAEAVFLDMQFDGEVIVSSSYDLDQKIEDQLLYTIGQLNGENSVSRLDKLDLTEVDTLEVDGATRVSYHAALMVAWGDKDDVPARYTFQLPHDIRYGAQDDFYDNYSESCVDPGGHASSASMWYYYRPDAYRCELADDDIIEVEATVSVSDANTTGKYPEYHKVWEDDQLHVAAVFGKYDDGAASSSDAGIRAYNHFVESAARRLDEYDVQTEPAELPDSPGVDAPEVSFHATLDDGRTVDIVALLVDNVRRAGRDFDRRYAELSANADLLAYNGHAGLGSNIRAMAQKGDWQTGQYSIVFMNGCDTYAYVDSALNDAHSAVNPDDPTGAKYVDLVMNAMPAFFREMDDSTMVLVDGLLDYDSPQTYEQMFADFDDSQVVLVSGEQDNEYVPGFEDGGHQDRPVDDAWQGLRESGQVRADQNVHLQTPTLAEGAYRFELSGTDDADLYVRLGMAPSVDEYDCRPYRTGSHEVCEVELSSPAPIHLMVRGWAASSEFELIGEAIDQ